MSNNPWSYGSPAHRFRQEAERVQRQFRQQQNDARSRGSAAAGAAAEAAAGARKRRLAASFVEVVDGPATGQRIALSDASLLIGRGAQGAGRLGDDPTLSRQHARLSLRGNQVLVEDLRSANGTFVNGKRIAGEWVAYTGDKIRVGHTTLIICGESELESSALGGSVEERIDRQPSRLFGAITVMFGIVVIALLIFFFAVVISGMLGHPLIG